MSGPQFFQTVMGRDFFQNHLPRLVRAVETLVSDKEVEMEATAQVVESLGPLSPPDDSGAWRCLSVVPGHDRKYVVLWERPRSVKVKVQPRT